MSNLRSIPGIGKSSLELLEAAGFLDSESLAKAGAEELVTELERANKILQIAKRAPARANVEKWIAAARKLTGVAVDVKVESVMPVNYEESPQVASMLANAPFAIPLPARHLVERGLAVSDIPAAIFLNRYSGDLEVRVEERIPKAQVARTPAANNFVIMAETPPQQRLEIDASRLKSTDAMTVGTVRAARSTPLEEDDRVALIRGPRMETNRGRSASSPFYVRGVLHSHPISLGVGAVVTLILAVVLPASILSAALLLLSDQFPVHFSWVPKWLLAFPLSLPIFGIAYLIWGLGGSCRICGQKQFVPRVCIKNIKAHHVRGLGYIIPVSVHMLLFKWFRCTYCGTPVRLKK